jgi:hypothetical protein
MVTAGPAAEDTTQEVVQDVAEMAAVCFQRDPTESRLEGRVNRANLKFINLSTTTSRVSVRNINESEREGEKQIAGK